MARAGQTNLEFYIFNRSGGCLYSHDLVSGKVNSTEQADINKQKLLFGLLWAMRGIAEKVSTVPGQIVCIALTRTGEDFQILCHAQVPTSPL